MTSPIVFSFQKSTRASLDKTWAALSDTDAFNRLARAGFSYPPETSPRASGALPVGVVKKLGLTIRFQEEPFRFRAPHRFSITRHFESGPAKSLRADLNLTPLPEGGTRVDYQLALQPKSALLKPILAIDLGSTTRRYVNAALDQVLAHLDEHPDAPALSLLTPPPLAERARMLLLKRSHSITPSPLLDTLLRTIAQAPDQDAAMLSPVTLSRQVAQPLDEVAALMLAATDVGLLSVRLDLLCPICQVPKAVVTSDPQSLDVHCPTCQIPLDGSFANSLAVHFFPHPEIRSIDQSIACFGSPARSPEIRAQDWLQPNEETDLSVPLAPGTYQLRTVPKRGAGALITVAAEHPDQEARVRVTNLIFPQLLRISPRSSIRFKNESAEPILVVLEQVVSPVPVVTLGRLLVEFPEIARFLPSAGFYSTMACYRALALTLRLRDEEAAHHAASNLAGSRVCYVSAECVHALYSEPGTLLGDLAQLDLQTALIGLALGPAFEHVVAGRSVPMGPAVEASYRNAFLGPPGVITLPSLDHQDEGLQAAISHGAFEARTLPYGRADLAYLVRRQLV